MFIKKGYLANKSTTFFSYFQIFLTKSVIFLSKSVFLGGTYLPLFLYPNSPFGTTPIRYFIKKVSPVQYRTHYRNEVSWMYYLHHAAKAHECHGQEAGCEEGDRSSLHCFWHFSHCQLLAHTCEQYQCYGKAQCCCDSEEQTS